MATAHLASMLDELMGRNRNVAPNENVRELQWSDSEVCKYYVVEFCPHGKLLVLASKSLAYQFCNFQISLLTPRLTWGPAAKSTTIICGPSFSLRKKVTKRVSTWTSFFVSAKGC